ncbi:MAG TPA: hypothetical protein VEO53_05830, partial [Candidatus Binatia bacterium]|nr:hypothetical protein [Candidatus Binatia bacterium]
MTFSISFKAADSAAPRQNSTRRRYLFSVAAGVPPAVEPGILPGGLSCGLRLHFPVQNCRSGQQIAVLDGSQDGCR